MGLQLVHGKRLRHQCHNMGNWGKRLNMTKKRLVSIILPFTHRKRKKSKSNPFYNTVLYVCLLCVKTDRSTLLLFLNIFLIFILLKKGTLNYYFLPGFTPAGYLYHKHTREEKKENKL